jgi:Flp pilus assembly protein TadD
MSGRVAVLPVVLLGLSLCAPPAFGGIFDSERTKEQAPLAASDEVVQQIQIAFDDQRYLDASKLLDRAVITSSSDSRLTYWAGELSLVQGRYQDALANFKAVKTDPKVRALALVGEGIALAKLGRGNDALTSLQAAVKEDPTAWRAWNALGSEYDGRHDWANADDAYTQAITISGGAAIALNNRGFSRLSQKKPDLAIADFVAALQKRPDLASARNNLRLAMSMQGEYDRAIKGAPAVDQASVLNNAGYAAMLRGDYVKAKELLTQAMKAKDGFYARAAANLEMTQNLAGGQVKDEGNASSR